METLEFTCSQGSQRNFPEIYRGAFGVILQADISEVWAPSPIRFVIVLFGGNRLALLVVRDFRAVDDDDCPRTSERDLHRVPLTGSLFGSG